MESEDQQPSEENGAKPSQLVNDETDSSTNAIVTTDEEREGYLTAKAILHDTQSYCGILLDDRNRKPICRPRFNRATNYLCLINHDQPEEKVAITKLTSQADDFAARGEASRGILGAIEVFYHWSCVKPLSGKRLHTFSRSNPDPMGRISQKE